MINFKVSLSKARFPTKDENQLALDRDLFEAVGNGYRYPGGQLSRPDLKWGNDIFSRLFIGLIYTGKSIAVRNTVLWAVTEKIKGQVLRAKNILPGFPHYNNI